MGVEIPSLGVLKAIKGAASYVANRLYKNLDKNRDEDSKLVSSIEEKIEELCSLGSQYWSKDFDGSEQQKNLQMDIVIKFDALSRSINKLRIHDINCEAQFNRFKQCITGSDFESAVRKSNLSIVNVDISKYAHALTAVLQSSYAIKYRK